MSGRHRESGNASSSGGSLTYGAAALAVVLLVAGAVFGVSRAVGGCDSSSEFTIAADPSIAPVIKKVLAKDGSAGLACVALTVKATEPAATLSSVATGASAPALWIPDSSFWLARAGQSTGVPVDLVTSSLAETPAVLLGQDGDPAEVDTWLDALRLNSLRLGDPLSSAIASAPIIASLAESEADKSDPRLVSAALVPIAQAQLSGTSSQSADKRIEAVRAKGGYTVVSEQKALSSSAAGRGSVSVPKSGSVFLDFPLAVTEPSSGDHAGAKKAGVALASLLTSDAGLKDLAASGFRTANAAPLSGGRGVGDVKPIILADHSSIFAALKKYALLALPVRALAVEDISGSMAFRAGLTTRMALTIKASETGIGLFPDESQVGLWSFSTRLDGDKDYTKLVGTRRMDVKIGDSTQREALLKAIGNLKPKAGGATGLYDTTLAAYREAVRGYDPKAVNSVIILTDGVNEDPGSISLAELIATLKKESDPTRPVIIVTIGITKDADAKVLEQISTATGGTSYIARDPADIPGVFVKALQNRG